MKEIEELQNLLDVLKKYNLPVSPILEYAIKKKIESLYHMEREPVPVEENQICETEKDPDVYVNEQSGTKRISTIRIIRPDGSVIEEKKAAQTMSSAIREIGSQKVYDLKIPQDGMFLVTKGGNPNYQSAQYDVGNGLFVNTHSSTSTKKRQFEKIFSLLKLDWKVEIV
jgi:hypothetical protein